MLQYYACGRFDWVCHDPSFLLVVDLADFERPDFTEEDVCGTPKV